MRRRALLVFFRFHFLSFFFFTMYIDHPRERERESHFFIFGFSRACVSIRVLRCSANGFLFIAFLLRVQWILLLLVSGERPFVSFAPLHCWIDVSRWISHFSFCFFFSLQFFLCHSYFSKLSSRSLYYFVTLLINDQHLRLCSIWTLQFLTSSTSQRLGIQDFK